MTCHISALIQFFHKKVHMQVIVLHNQDIYENRTAILKRINIKKYIICSFITVTLSFKEPRSESPLLLSNKSSPRLRLESAEISRAKKWNRISLAESDKFHSATDLGKLLF